MKANRSFDNSWQISPESLAAMDMHFEQTNNPNMPYIPKPSYMYSDASGKMSNNPADLDGSTICVVGQMYDKAAPNYIDPRVPLEDLAAPKAKVDENGHECQCMECI